MAHGARGEYITGRLVKTRKSVGERFVIVNPSCRQFYVIYIGCLLGRGLNLKYVCLCISVSIT